MARVADRDKIQGSSLIQEYIPLLVRVGSGLAAEFPRRAWVKISALGTAMLAPSMGQGKCPPMLPTMQER